jgi:subtilisin family serine protease
MRGRFLFLLVMLLALAGAQTAGGASSTQKSVLVGYSQGADPAALIQSVGGQVTSRYKYVDVVAATIPADQTSALDAKAGIRYVEDNRQFYPLGRIRQTTDYGVAKIQAPAAWALGQRGAGVKVGIFDSGIDLQHPDLQVAGGIDLLGDGHGLDDCLGHGTHVAGIVGARDNGRGTVGVAPSASLYAMRFFDCEGGGATAERELQGLEWAIDNGMQVVNMSFGCCTIEGAVTVPLPVSLAEEEAMNAAYEHGIVLIAASGNASEPVVSYPAAYASVVAVGATDENDQLATFSSFGSDQELTAPGVNNLSTFPVGTGQTTDLTVNTDGGRALDAIAMEFSGLTAKRGITASTIYAGLGALPSDYGACAGKTAVVMRGGPTFALKTEAAMNAGCAAIVIHNNQPGNFNGTLGAPAASDGRAWIPAVSISLDEGLYLKDKIAAGATTTTLLNVTGDYTLLSGTSMASPHATGVAALIRGKNASLAPDQVRAILRSSSDDKGAPGWDPTFGYGRVNALKAVTATP